MPRGKERPICQVFECDMPHKGHGFCGKHYQRWLRYGDPDFVAVLCGRGLPLEERILNIGWELTDQGCHEWKGYRSRDGYGVIRDENGKPGQVHRLWFELAYGKLTSDEMVCHKCDNPPCINLHHLFVGTAADNNRDRSVKGRSSRGEMHYAHKLKWWQVALIRKTYAEGGITQQTLADYYGVSQQVISSIIRKQTWWIDEEGDVIHIIDDVTPAEAMRLGPR